jgi:hypothetical protein
MQTQQDRDKVQTLWQHKPRWCQPWSILLTGGLVVGASWWLLKVWWVTTLAAVAVLAWWTLFLIVMPRAWGEAMAAESRQ